MLSILLAAAVVAAYNTTVQTVTVSNTKQCQSGFEIGDQVWLACRMVGGGTGMFTINSTNLSQPSLRFKIGTHEHTMWSSVYSKGFLYYSGQILHNAILLDKQCGPYNGAFLLKSTLNGTILWAQVNSNNIRDVNAGLSVLVDHVHGQVYSDVTTDQIPCTLYASSISNGTLNWQTQYTDIPATPQGMIIEDIYFGRTSEELFTYGQFYNYQEVNGPTFHYNLRAFNSSGQSVWVQTTDSNWGHSSVYNLQKGEFYNLQDCWDSMYGQSTAGQADFLLEVLKFGINDSLTTLATRHGQRGLMFGGTLQDYPTKLLYRKAQDKFVVTGSIQGNFSSQNYINKGQEDAIIVQLFYNLTIDFIHLIGTPQQDVARQSIEAQNGTVVMVAGTFNNLGSYQYWVEPNPNNSDEQLVLSASATPNVPPFEQVASTSAIQYPMSLTNHISAYSQVLIETDYDMSLPHYDFTNLGQSTQLSATQLGGSVNLSLRGTSIDQFAVVLIVLAAVIMYILCCVGCVCYRRFKQRSSSKQVESITTTEVGQTTMSNSTTNFATTILVTSHVMSVPLYLLREYGKDFELGQQINRGGVGSIHTCRILDSSKFPTNLDFAVKIFKDPAKQMIERQKVAFYNEVALMNMLRDQPQFARLHAYTEAPAAIVMTFYKLGSLKQFIFKPSRYPYTPKQLMLLIREFAVGLCFHHQKGFLHSDIKPDNVLIELGQQGLLEPRITDFGLTKQVDNLVDVKAFKFNEVRGLSVCYASPEVHQNFRFSSLELHRPKAADIYSTSIMLWEMLTRSYAWVDRDVQF